jgi:hypothetical protein
VTRQEVSVDQLARRRHLGRQPVTGVGSVAPGAQCPAFGRWKSQSVCPKRG